MDVPAAADQRGEQADEDQETVDLFDIVLQLLQQASGRLDLCPGQPLGHLIFRLIGPRRIRRGGIDGRIGDRVGSGGAKGFEAIAMSAKPKLQCKPVR